MTREPKSTQPLGLRFRARLADETTEIEVELA